MPSLHHRSRAKGAAERARLAALVSQDYARCHPDDTLEALERRACFSKAALGLLRDWLSVAAARRAAEPARGRRRDAAA